MQESIASYTKELKQLFKKPDFYAMVVVSVCLGFIYVSYIHLAGSKMTHAREYYNDAQIELDCADGLGDRQSCDEVIMSGDSLEIFHSRWSKTELEDAKQLLTESLTLWKSTEAEALLREVESQLATKSE